MLQLTQIVRANRDDPAFWALDSAVRGAVVVSTLTKRRNGNETFVMGQTTMRS